jgi:hemolysin activation/secretion protein
MFRPCNRLTCGDARGVIQKNSNWLKPLNFRMIARACPLAGMLRLALFLWLAATCGSALGAEPVAATARAASLVTNATPHFQVNGYTVEGRWLLPTNILVPMFAKYTGTNVSLREIIHAASDLETEYRHAGYLLMNIAIAPQRITNGIVTLNALYPGTVPQIIVSGKRYLVTGDEMEAPTNPALAVAAAITNTNHAPAFQQLNRPATPEEMARAYTALMRAMDEISARERDTRVHVVTATTNAGPRFAVEKYQIEGNTLLPPATIATLLTNIDGAYGTNVSLDGIRAAVLELRAAYRARGFVSVDVSLPPQKLTNATVKIQVTEGRLMAIDVKGNHYFSSNNVMRALPSLHTNMILNAQIFQAELDRANADQDRQISPIIDPGPDPGTSDLTLYVKDRLPFHGKLELDNQSSPGTPDMRVNSSAVYDNLWQRQNSLGIQYGFSPDQYKEGKQWNFYDLPLVANYSTFYRLPLGNPVALEDELANSSGNFGYDEATHKFNLPPPSGQPDLTVFASRSTIDTSLSPGANKNIFTSGTTNFGGGITTNSTLNLTSPNQDLTINDDVGFRLSLPLAPAGSYHSSFSGGMDFKSYNLSSVKTNIYTLNSQIIDTLGGTPETNYNSSTDIAALPSTVNQLYYLPLSVRYDGGWRDALGQGSVGLGASANLWYSASTQHGSGTNQTSLQGLESLQKSIANSKKATGHWVVLTPSLSHDFQLVTNWVTTVRADGQWSSEPLVSNEQFGSGGVNSVRGYHEGEVFGDTGWHVSLEQQTPRYVVGTVYGHTLMTLRGTAYMDFANTYLLDPQGRASHSALWGVGFGAVAAIGSQWEARVLFSLPLLDSPTINAFQPYFNFAVTAQF